MAIKIKVSTGGDLPAYKIKALPYGPIFLAEVLQAKLSQPMTDVTWIGSPAWVAGGLISDQIYEHLQSKGDKKRIQEIHQLIELARSNPCWMEAANLIAYSFDDMSEVKALGAEFDFDREMPRKKKWKGFLFGGYEGTFSGITLPRFRHHTPQRECHARS